MVRKKTTPQHADVLDAAKTGDLAFLDDGCRLLVSDLDGEVREFGLCDGANPCDVTDGGCVTSQPFGDAGDEFGPGAPSSVAINPSADDTDADVVFADPIGRRVVACDLDGLDCGTFGQASAAAAAPRGSDPRADSDFHFVFFAPRDAPTTSTTTSSSTTTTTLAPR